MAGLSFVTLVAYDAMYLPEVVASYYDIADEIVLGLDKDRVSWTGRPFQLDLAPIKAALEALDHGHKIRWVEEDFRRGAKPLECETDERTRLAALCAPGHWVVQIDADEILLNPREFRDWLLLHGRPGINYVATWVMVYKRFESDVLVIDDNMQVISMATLTRGAYLRGRKSTEPERMSPLKLLHFAWGRSDAEVQEKLGNWGHSQEVDTEAFLKRWRGVSLENHLQQFDLHPLWGPFWPRLRRLPLRPAGALEAAALAIPSRRRVPGRLDWKWQQAKGIVGRLLRGRV